MKLLIGDSGPTTVLDALLLFSSVSTRHVGSKIKKRRGGGGEEGGRGSHSTPLGFVGNPEAIDPPRCGLLRCHCIRR